MRQGHFDGRRYAAMMNALKQYRVFTRANHTHKAISILTWVVYVLLICIISNSLLINSSSDKLYENAAIYTNGGVVSYYILGKGDREITFDYQNESLERLLKQASVIERYSTIITNINSQKQNIVFVFRDSIPEDSCIVSSNIADNIGAKARGMLTLDALNISLSVSDITGSTLGTQEAQYFGCITLNEKYAEMLLGYPLEFANIHVGFPTEREALGGSFFFQSAETERFGFHNSDELFRSFDDKNIAVAQQNYDKIMDDYVVALEVIEDVISSLSILSFIIFSVGFSAMLYMNFEANTKNYAILRTFGLKRKIGYRITIIDAFLFTLSANIISIPFVYLTFAKITERSFGFAVIPETAKFIYTFFALLILGVIVILPIRIWLLKKIYSLDAVNVLNDRASAQKVNNIWLPLLSIVVFTICISIILANSDLIFITVAMIVVLLLIYLVTKGVLHLLKSRAKSVNGYASLALKLLVGKRNQSAIISTAFVSVALFSLLIYSIGFGISDILESTWIDRQGYNIAVTVPAEDSAKFESLINQYDFEYFQIYTKLMKYPNTDRPYFLGILKDGQGTSETLKVAKGTFVADRIVSTVPIELHSTYAFVDQKQLTFAEYIPPLGITPVSYTVLTSYEDFGYLVDNVDNTYINNYLFLNTQAENQLLNQLLSNWPVQITSSDIISSMLVTGMVQYVTVIYMVSALIILVLFIFIISMFVSDLLQRKAELSIYRSIGYKKRTIRRIISVQYSILICISCLLAFALSSLLLNIIMLSFLGVWYAPEPWIVLALLITLMMVNFLVLRIVMRIVKFDSLMAYKAPL